MKRINIHYVLLAAMAFGTLFALPPRSAIQNTNQVSSVKMANVNALTGDEESESSSSSSGRETNYVRVDDDCVYKVTGQVGSEVSLSIVGVGIVKLRVGGDGTASYYYSKGSTDCASGGNHMCEARYCPQLRIL